MTTTTITDTTELCVSDVSGQKKFQVKAPNDATVGELIKGLLARIGLSRNDESGRPLTYRARLRREGRHLNDGERVGEVLRESDELSLHPNVDAG